MARAAMARQALRRTLMGNALEALRWTFMGTPSSVMATIIQSVAGADFP
jgi:hypothetical protein